MTLKRLAMALLALVLLAGCVSVSRAEGDLKPYQLIEQEAFLSSFQEYDPEAVYSWAPWEGESWLLNDIFLTAGLREDQSIAYVSCDGDIEDKQSLEALKSTLRMLYEGDQTPEIERMIDAGEEAELSTDIGPLYLEAGSFTLNYQSDFLPSMKADEFEQFLRDSGLLEGELFYSRSARLGKKDYRADVEVDFAGRLKDLKLWYYGADAESGKAFFSAMCPELIAGQELKDTLGMISEKYDALEIRKRVILDPDGLVITLYRAKNYYRLSFDVETIPWNAAAFTDQMTPTAAAAAASQGPDPEVYSGIDTEAQIPETVIFEGNGVKVTALRLVYGKSGGGADCIGLKLLVEKDEGVSLDRIAFPVTTVNRWKGDFSFFDQKMYYPKGTKAEKAETTAWWKLDDLKRLIPGFDGISSLKVGVNLIPPDGAGETIRGEAAELSTGRPESPLPGVTLYSDDKLTFNLTGIEESTDRRFVLGVACDNRGSKASLGIHHNGAYLNDFRFYGCDMQLDVPEGLRAVGTMTLERQALADLGITDLNQVESLKIRLTDYNVSPAAIGEVLITRADLGLEAPADDAPAQETVLYENAGVRMLLAGLSPDGGSLDLIMQNESADAAVLQVRLVSANGWQLNRGGWEFSAKAGKKDRQLVPVAFFIPDFKELADVKLQVFPCRFDENYGIYMAIYEQAQEASVTFGQAATHEDQGTELYNGQGVRLMLTDIRTSMEGYLEARMVLINETDTCVRFSDAHDPLKGTSMARCSINGIEKEFYTLFSDRTQVDAGLRAEVTFRIPLDALADMGLKAEDVQTIDFEWSLFPDADKIDYQQYNIRIAR